MNTTKSNGLTATNSQPAETQQNKDHRDFPTGERQRKDESTLLARLALAGYVVTRGDCNDYTVNAHYCQDLTELTAYADRLGVRNV